MKRILVCGLNPAWQKTLMFSRLVPGEVNRAESMTEIASGKGINFARAVRIWGNAVCGVLHPIGGMTGNRIEDSMAKEGILSLGIRVNAATRTCSTLMCRESGSATEIIEPSGTITPPEYEQILQKAAAELKNFDALAICGTYPPGIPESCYGDLAALAAAQGKPVLLDAYKGIGDALTRGVTVLKINSGELAAMTGCGTIEDGIRFCLKKYPVAIAAITAGKDYAVIGDRNGITRINVPQISNAVNPIGAGDTCAGVFFSNWLAGVVPEEAFSLGICAATASCMTGTPALYDKVAAESLRCNCSLFSL